jgi:hypothetical protein
VLSIAVFGLAVQCLQRLFGGVELVSQEFQVSLLLLLLIQSQPN